MANFNFNKVILGGRLTADPELKMTKSNTPATSFTVAVSRKAKADAEPQTDFIDCVAWRERAQFVTQYFRKGSSICVEGSLQKRSYTDKQGATRYAVEVNVDNVYFVDSKSKSESAPTVSQTVQTAQRATYIPEAYMQQQSAEPTMKLNDDEDLPF